MHTSVRSNLLADGHPTADPDCAHCSGFGLLPKHHRITDKVHLMACRCTTITGCPEIERLLDTELGDMADRTWQTFRFEGPNRELRQDIADYVATFLFPRERNAVNLVLCGEPGVGKSHLAAAVLRQWARIYPLMYDRYQTRIAGAAPPEEDLMEVRMARFRYVNVADMIEKSRKFDDDEVERDLVRACKVADFLVLDDLGAEYGKSAEGSGQSWAGSRLYAALDERINGYRPTLVTTNIAADQLTELARRDRVASRIIRNANGNIHEVARP